MINCSHKKNVPANISAKLLRQSMHKTVISSCVSSVNFLQFFGLKSQEELVYMSSKHI